jgi:hypothetical protein
LLRLLLAANVIPAHLRHINDDLTHCTWAHLEGRSHPVTATRKITSRIASLISSKLMRRFW